MKKLQLVLTNPCSERWDNLQQAGTGRYCNRCEKNIVDLTGKSDAELIQFFKRKKENVCGRLLSSQLNRELVLPPATMNWHWLVPLVIGASVVSPAQAKELRPVIMQNNQAAPFPSASVIADVKSPVTASLGGQVLDNRTGAPLKGVKVRQKGFENVLAITDSAGKFRLETSEEASVAVFTFELNGYSRVEAKVSDGMVIKMALEQSIMLGGISAIGVHNEPLYVVYVDKKSCTIAAANLQEISPDWIEKIDVLKDAKATALYGAKAANGVILIGIKKAYAKKINFSKKN